MMARRGIEKGWRAWAAIQIFVATANGKIRMAPGKVDGQRPGGMRKVPDHQRPGIMRGTGQGRHVMQAAVTVIDVCQHQHRGVVIKGRSDLLRPVDMDKPVPVAALPDHPFGDVVVGRKIACLGDDLRPLRAQ